MRKQLNLIKKLMIVVALLAVFQVILLSIAPDTKHIILTSIVGAGLILIVIFYIITKLEVNKIVFESQSEEYKTRLVEYDDFIKVRELMDEAPLENTEEEKLRLEEYEAITVDFVRIKYHYIVFKGEEAVALFHSKKEKDNWIIKIIKTKEDEEKLKEIILNNTKIDKTKLSFEN